MTPEERKTYLEKQLTKDLNPIKLTIIDESQQHIGHAGASTGASHFAIEIKSSELDGLNKVKQHQKIYASIGELIPSEIHALRIIVL